MSPPRRCRFCAAPSLGRLVLDARRASTSATRDVTRMLLGMEDANTEEEEEEVVGACEECRAGVRLCVDLALRCRRVGEAARQGRDMGKVAEEEKRRCTRLRTALGKISRALEEGDDREEEEDGTLKESSLMDLVVTKEESPSDGDSSKTLPGSRGRVVSVQESRARAASACPAKVRKILPKVSLNPGQSVDIAQLSQLMIPVTVRAPCSGCGETIVATKFQDLKGHICKKRGKKAVTGRPRDEARESKHDQSGAPVGPKTKLDPLRTSTAATTSTAARGGRRRAAKAKLFRCTHAGCNKSYSAKTYLVEHSRTHTRERPFTCRGCPKRFFRVLDLKKHQLLKLCK